MAMVLQNVTDEQLTASTYVTLLFLVILTGAMILNVFFLIRRRSVKARIFRVIVIGVLVAVFYVAYGQYTVENNLLHHPQYVAGNTTEYGSVFLKGEGVVFEYTVGGKTYRNCNTFHPVPKSKITVPNGRYMIRYANGYESEGRIDLSRPVETR